MKRVFFCGVLPSKYSGRWRDWPHFDFAKEKRNSPQTPLPLFLCSNGTGTEAGGQKFLPPNPLPFCPPAWASPPKLFGERIFRRNLRPYFAKQNAPPKEMLPLTHPTHSRATLRNSLFVCQILIFLIPLY
jgi:hypothetical protein